MKEKNKKLKQIISIFLIINIFSFFFAGCVPIVNLNRRGLVESIGLDYEDNLYKISFQIFNSSASIGSNGAESSSNGSNMVIKSEGKTIMDAMKRVSLKQDRKLYYRVTNIIILGKNIVNNKNRFKQTINFLNKTYMDNPNINIILSQNKASDIIEANIKETQEQSNFILEMINNAQDQCYIPKIHLDEIIISLDNLNKASMIPIIKVIKSDNKHDKLNILGAGIIDDGVLLGSISIDEIKFLMLLLNQGKKLSFIVNSSQFGLSDFNILKKKISLKPNIINDKLVIDIALKLKTNLIENQKGLDIKDLSNNDIKILEKNQKDYIKSQIYIILNKLLKKYKVDVLYITNDIFRSNFDYWQQHKDDWKSILSDADINLSVECDIFKSVVQKSKDY